MSDPDIASAEAGLAVVSAMESLVTTIRKIHTMFVGLAIVVPILLVIFMVICSFVIAYVTWGVEQRMVTRMNTVPGDVAKALSIQQHQTTIIKDGEGDTVDNLAKRVLVKQGLIEQ